LKRARHLQQDQYRRIAVFRALKLGDLMCAVPALRALRRAFPQAEITLVGLPWARDFVDRFPHLLDDFIEFPGHPAFPERPLDVPAVPEFFEEMVSRRFDLAVQMHGSGSIINPLMVLMGAHETAGYYLPGEYCPEPERYIVYPAQEPEIWRHLSLMAYLGLELQGDHLEFPLHGEDHGELARLKRSSGILPGPYVIVHPGASSCDKCWPVERFAAAAERFAERGYQVILTGTQAEQHLTQAVSAAMQHESVDLAGMTSLGTLGALVDGAHLLVSNDTGIAHLAAALETPSVILFTNSEHRRWAPLNRALHHTITEAQNATAEDVIGEAEALLPAADRKVPTHAN
jgi:ADP-heptose:LPS heptosyltransferase